MKSKTRPRRKIVTNYSQKKKSASLSQLHKIASYKKKIKDLVHNNRRLAVELEKAQCVITAQSKLYGTISRKFMDAQKKIRDAAKSITTLVSDIDDVKNYLDIDWTPMKEIFLQSRYTSDAKIVKATELDGIEEFSVLSSEPQVTYEKGITPSLEPQIICEKGTPPPLPLLLQCSQHESNDEEKMVDLSELHYSNGNRCIQELTEVVSIPERNEMPPVLFVEESETNKRNTRSNIPKSDGSLTPELDIDYAYTRKKSSSRRQTLFRTSDTRKNKSGERVASWEQAEQMQCEVSLTDDCIIQVDKTSITQANSPDQLKNSITSTDSSEVPTISTNVATCANVHVSNVDMPSLGITSFAHPKLEVIPQGVENNHTLLLNDDMELTDVLNPSCNLIVVANSTVTDIDQRYEPVTSSRDKQNKIIEEKTENIKDKLNEANISITNEQGSFSAKEIPFQEHITKNRKRDRKSSQMVLESPLQGVTTRPKTGSDFAIFFTDDSDSDWTPSKTVKKKKREERETAFFVSEAISKNSVAENIENCFSEQKNSFENKSNLKSNEASVFSFNASFSDKPSNCTEKKKSKLSRNKKFDKGKNVSSKPISQSCNVTKLKGFDFRFSKNKKADKKSRSGDPKRSETASNIKSCTPPSNVMEKVFSTFENTVNGGTPPSSDRNAIKYQIADENKCNISLIDGSFFSPRTILKNRILTELGRKSETKRVSFHGSDLVCNFTKTSVSKTISGNAKVWRTSKSVVDLGEIRSESCSKLPHGVLSNENASDGDVDAQESSVNYSDETEIYKLPHSITGGFHMFGEIDDLSLSRVAVSSLNELQSNKELASTDKSDVLIKKEIDVICFEEKDTLLQTNVQKKVSEMDVKDIQPESSLNIKNKCSSKKIHGSSKENIRNKSKTDILCRNKKHNSAENDILSKKNLVKKETSMGDKIMLGESAASSASKVKNKCAPRKSCSSSKENIPIKSNKACKHRTPKILGIFSTNDHHANEIFEDNSQHSNKDSKASDLKDTLLEKDGGPRSSKQQKSKSVPSFPVLVDTLNVDSSSIPPRTSLTKPVIEELTEVIPLEKPRTRRSKPISYKEPSLHKKMRRDF